MKITFIPVGTSQDRPAFGHHLGLMYLASAAREWTNLDPKMNILDMRTHQMTIPQVLHEVKNNPPDLIGISAKTCEVDVAKALINRLKSWRPEIQIMVGGSHVSADPYDIMESTKADSVVIGEGERTFADYLNNLADGKDVAGIPGTLVRSKNELIMGSPRSYIEDVDSIPFPAWDLIDIDLFSKVDVPSFFLARDKYMAVFSSRACPYKCIYCHQVFGKKFRPRSPENVLQELEILYEKYGIREIHFIDDVFNLDKKRVLAICNGILERKMDIAISFPNGLKGDILDEETILKLREAGTYSLHFGVESGSQRILELIGKNQNLEKIQKVVEICDREGMITAGFFMMGFPSETAEELELTRRYALDNPFTRIEIAQVTAIPGTPLFEMVKQTYPEIDVENDPGRFLSEKSWYFEATGISIPKIFRRTYRDFYLNPKRMWKLFWRVPKKSFLLKGLLQFIQISSPSHLAKKEAEDFTSEA